MNGRTGNEEGMELEPVVRSLEDVNPTSIAWLWPGRVACGTFSLMVGDPGLGKSLVALDVAARVSRGDSWPEGTSSATPGSVLLLNGEDDVAGTVVPRLNAMGADLSRVQIIKAVRTRNRREEMSFSLARHLDQLEWALVEMDHPRLVVIDPISSFLWGVNSHSNTAVRQMLAELGQLAERWEVAVLAVTHFAKSVCGYTLRGALGSTAFVAAARGVWLVSGDPLDPSRRLLLQLKNNLGERAPGLAFRVASSDTVKAPVVQWDCLPVELTAEEVAKLARALLRNPSGAQRKTPRQEAAECLRELMADGPRMSNELLSEAMDQGFAERTIRRALRDMGAKAHRCGEFGSHYYMLPGQEVVVPEKPMDRWLELEERERDRRLKA